MLRGFRRGPLLGLLIGVFVLALTTGAVAIAGAALFALALLWVVVASDSSPDFLGVWLPYGLVGGAGIGLGLPALIGATAAGLPAGRFATGMALATTARQLGAVIGVALLVAVIGTPAPGRRSRGRPDPPAAGRPAAPAVARGWAVRCRGRS